MVDIAVNRKNLVCLEYPAIIKNVDRMIKTLGGEDRVSQVYSDPSRRMELRFRPDDMYCKPVCGDRVNTSYMLMKVRRRKKKNSSENAQCEFKVEIEGIVNVTYKFRSMADFQYLPMCKKPDGKYEDLLPKFVPQGLPSPSWLKEEAPLFAVPIVFSRFDTPSNYHYRRGPTHRDSTKQIMETQPPNIISGRKRRIGYAVFVSFEEKDIPAKPIENALAKVDSVSEELLEKTRKLFEERPIWTKNALTTTLGCTGGEIKGILPCVAFYYTTGPWRSTWVRFGYDPRKLPSTKQYQVLDFRLKLALAKYFEKIKPKRSTHSYMFSTFKSATGASRPARIQVGEKADQTSEAADSVDNSAYLKFKFIAGHLPPYHQIYYQLCDIEVDEIQELIHKNDGKEVQCHEKYGWLLAGTLEKCRQILTKDIKQTMDRIRKEEKQSEGMDEAMLEEGVESDEDYEDTGEMEYPSDPEYDPLDDEMLMYMDN